jgi:hypothetical protein
MSHPNPTKSSESYFHSASILIRRWRLVSICISIFVLVLISNNRVQAMPRIGEVEAFWEDSLAIIRPEISDPLTISQLRTLETGVPIRVEVEVRFTRTGYVKKEVVNVTVEYDVWTGWYRVTTPLSPFAIQDYSTVERLFQHDMLLLFNADDLDPDTPWFVKVRAGADTHEEDEDEDSDRGVANDLTGFTRLLFKFFDNKEDRGEWSELVKLPERDEALP